jgi:hypothetical protein
VRDAAMMPMRRKLLSITEIKDVADHRTTIEAPLTMEDFNEAVKNI